jgi:hypothetical protein
MNPTRTRRWAALALAAALVGCDNPPAPSPNPAPSPAPAPKPDDHKAAETKSADAKPAKKLDIAGAKLNEKELGNVGKLDEADRKVALEQKLCPMTGAHLGAMGKPVKVMLKDQVVFLCCDSCEEDATAKPEATLARLGR